MNTENDFTRLLEELEEVTPYGTLVTAPTAAIAPISHASQEAARNLLSKAVAKGRAGDSEGSEKMIGRAARIAFDDHERMWPGVGAAGGLVFELISDQAEAVAEYEEWLHSEEVDDDEYADLLMDPPVPVEFGLRSLRGKITELEAAVAASKFAALASDGRLYGIPKAKRDRMLELLEVFPTPVEPSDVPETAPESEREDVIRACIRIVLMLEEVFET